MSPYRKLMSDPVAERFVDGADVEGAVVVLDALFPVDAPLVPELLPEEPLAEEPLAEEPPVAFADGMVR
jgi:hypothetical protein